MPDLVASSRGMRWETGKPKSGPGNQRVTRRQVISGRARPKPGLRAVRDEQTEDDAALAAVTAAVVGVILNLTVWFALNVLFSEHTTIWYGLLRLNVPNPSSLDPVALVLSASAGICWRDDGATGQVPASGSHG